MQEVVGSGNQGFLLGITMYFLAGLLAYEMFIADKLKDKVTAFTFDYEKGVSKLSSNPNSNIR